MKTIFGFLAAWIICAVATTAIGVFLQTQNVIARLDGVGADISIAQRLGMTVYDLLYLGSLYIIFVSLGTLIAYLTGSALYKLVGFGRTIIFVTAGAVAILVMLMLMKPVFFGIHMIGGARDALGIGLQMVAGGIGGYLFAHLSARFMHDDSLSNGSDEGVITA